MVKLYTLWAIAVLGMLGYAQYTGWSFTTVTEAKTNPRSVRNNPGSYRPSYYSPGRVLRGK
ncbi:MAG: hypothetical protein K2R93_11615 [Gemmatimonadaceae bacterium]|nr:hypothetical protein [Gemmatimonadaceae bacterium]